MILKSFEYQSTHDNRPGFKSRTQTRPADKKEHYSKMDKSENRTSFSYMPCYLCPRFIWAIRYSKLLSINLLHLSIITDRGVAPWKKVGRPKAQNGPHNSKNSVFIAFLNDNFQNVGRPGPTRAYSYPTPLKMLNSNLFLHT